MSIMLDTSLGIHCQVQIKLSIISFKGLRIIGKVEHKS